VICIGRLYFKAATCSLLIPLPQFDDIFLPNTNTSLPFLQKPYHNLNFTSFALFSTSSAPQSPPVDTDCASSGTNALVASRRPNEAWPRFLLDAKLAAEAGLAPFFNLHGFSQKPVGYVKAGTRLWVHALGIVDHGIGTSNLAEAFLTHLPHSIPIHRNSSHENWASDRYEIISSYTLVTVVQGDGYTDNFYLNMSGLFPGFGEMVNMVEVFAEAPTGEDEDGLYTGFEDWVFCIDDLVVEWISDEEVDGVGRRIGEGGRVMMNQVEAPCQDEVVVSDCKTRFMQVQVDI